MKVAFSIPKPKDLVKFIHGQQSKLFSYQNIGASKVGPQKGFDNDHNFVLLGQGERVWANAKNALKNWQQFPASWTKVYPNNTPLSESKTVAVLFKLFGIWWINSARVVYSIDEKDKFGFAYGTLPGHVEKGEELFLVERDQSGKVFYHIKAFSKPAYWFVWMVFPLARYFQRRFVRESMKIMQQRSNK